MARVYLDKHLFNGTKLRTFSGYFDMSDDEMRESAALEYVSDDEYTAWWWAFIERVWPFEKGR